MELVGGLLNDLNNVWSWSGSRTLPPRKQRSKTEELPIASAAGQTPRIGAVFAEAETVTIGGSSRKDQAVNSPPKFRKTLFEGFKSTLRGKSASESGPEKEKDGPAEEVAPAAVPQEVVLHKLAKVLMNFTASEKDEISLVKGDIVQIVETDLAKGCFVLRPAHEERPATEGWVPAFILAKMSSQKKPWSLKFRKPSFTSKSKDKEGVKLAVGTAIAPSNPSSPSAGKLVTDPFEAPPTFVQCMENLIVPRGENAVFKCQINVMRSAGRPSMEAQWTTPSGAVITSESGGDNASPGSVVAHVASGPSVEGFLSLQINGCEPANNGEYVCVVRSESGLQASCSSKLTVTDIPGPPPAPTVTVVTNDASPALCVQWCHPDVTGNLRITGYSVDMFAQVDGKTGSWNQICGITPEREIVIPTLQPNTSYKFRVSAINALGSSAPSESSNAVDVPSPEASSENEIVESELKNSTAFPKVLNKDPISPILPKRPPRSPSCNSRSGSPRLSAGMIMPVGSLKRRSDRRRPASRTSSTSGRSTPTRLDIDNLNSSESTSLPILRKQSMSFKPSYDRHFRDLEEIGRGRFSIVKKCWNVRESREVSVKFFRRQSEEVVKHEFGIHSLLIHKNVARAWDLYKARTGYAMIMEFVGTQSIFHYACRRRTYSESTVCAYMKQLLQAVSYLHSQSVIHGDIRPENLMADSSKSPPVLKVIDFGSAVKADENPNGYACLSHPHGSVEFSPPELLGKDRAKLSYGADLWSIGVVIYIFLGGVSPFALEDGQIVDVRTRVENVQYSYPDEYFSELSPEIKDVIDGLFQFLPEKRTPCDDCLNALWFKEGGSRHSIPAARLLQYMRRRQRMSIV
ncbi:unnamed protein product [Notodromas monacha]|uniref:Uncharacterized protein n=1 Tax=Notodromas monacha TaxID=399045 RepID=A0A7R9GCE2_9CRUS|nr:unnamed protein product [Notodromas monacha]CAG0917345.1 unnamed protein product [Notodromas monacha]